MRGSEEGMERRWLLTLLGVAVLALGACGSEGGPTAARTTQADASPSAVITPSPSVADPLEGEWRASLTCDAMQAALVRADLGSSLPDSLACPVEDVARFQSGRLAFFNDDELGWETTYEYVDEDTFVTSGEDVLTFDFHVAGDELVFDVVEPSDAVPFIAHWEAAPFELSS
jgi:hypothetical protein